MILDRLLDYVVAAPLHDGAGLPQDYRARCPSPGWCVKSWSYRLVQDLLLKRALHRSRLGEGMRWKLLAADRLTSSAYSYHHDADYKALLFSALRRDAADKSRIVVLPEVGPFGFDLLVARCAGFSRFIAYDRDQATVDTCRAFHRAVDAEYVVSSSAEFDFGRFASPEHLIVFPDWPHDALERRLGGFRNVVRYSDRTTHGSGLAQARRRLGVGRLDWDSLVDAMERLD